MIATTLVYGSSNTAATKSIAVTGGASNARVRVSAFTSGTANGAIRSTQSSTPAAVSLASVGATGAVVPASAELMGVYDPSTGNMVRLQGSPDGDLGIAVKASNGFQGEIQNWALPTTYGDLYSDPTGALAIRGNVVTDEGVVIDDFTGAALTTALAGTLSFTNGSTAVVGTGTSFLTAIDEFHYIKKTGDSETFWALVSDVIDNTHLTLATPYGGTTQAGQTAIVTHWATSTGAGASFAVGSSMVTLASGTGAVTSAMWLSGDYLPLNCTYQFSISQRIANHVGFIGVADNLVTPSAQAGFVFDGTTNTTVKCVSQSSSAATDITTTTVTLPGGVNTGSLQQYEVDLRPNAVVFLVNGIVVATIQNHIPATYTTMQMGMRSVAAATITTTSLVLDQALFESYDRIEVRTYNAIPSRMQVLDNGPTLPGAAIPTTYSPVLVGGSDGTNARIVRTDTSGYAAVRVTDQTNFMPTMDTAARSGFVRITDATNTAAVKAASTAAVAADTSLVVAISPNSFGSKTSANSFPVVVASDQAAIATKGAATPADAFANPTTANLAQALLEGFNGTTWDRLKAGANNADAVAVATLGILATLGYNMGWNGTTWDRLKSTTANGLQVDVTRVQGTVGVTTAPSDSTPGSVNGQATQSTATAGFARETTYTEQTANFTGSVSSNNAADASAGTGARTVIIYYYDSTLATFANETVTLNGTTPVNLVNSNHCFIERIVVATVGSGGVNAGVISLFTGAAGGGTLVGTIATGDNRTNWAHHYVLNGKTCNITGMSATSTGSQSCQMFLKARNPTSTTSPDVPVGDVIEPIIGGGNSGGTVVRKYGSPVQVAGPARVGGWFVPSGATTATYFVGFDFYDQ